MSRAEPNDPEERDLHRPVASRTGRHQCGSAPRCRARGGTGIRRTAPAGEAHAERTGGLHTPRSVRLPVRSDRRHPPVDRSRRTSIGQPGSQARGRRAARAGGRGRPAPAAVSAARVGDLAGLEKLFAADLVSYSDGGGVVTAARFPLVGRQRVAKFVTAIAPWFWVGVDIRWAQQNGQTTAVLSRDSVVFAVVTVDGSDSGINQLLWMMNPAKLAAVSAVEGDYV